MYRVTHLLGKNLPLNYLRQFWQLIGHYLSSLLHWQYGGTSQIQVKVRFLPSRCVTLHIRIVLTLVVGGRGPAVVLPEHDVQRLQRSQLVLVASAPATAARGRHGGRGGGRVGGRGVPPLSTPFTAAAASRSLLSRGVEGAGTRGKLLLRPTGKKPKYKGGFHLVFTQNFRDFRLPPPGTLSRNLSVLMYAKIGHIFDTPLPLSAYILNGSPLITIFSKIFKNSKG